MTVPVYPAARQIKVTIPFVDEQDEMVVPTALRWRLIDEKATELATWAVIDPPDLGNDSAEIIVSVAQNTLAAGAVHGFRRVELEITHDAGVSYGYADYIVELKNPLIYGVNSFQTYEQAQLTALTLGKLEGWEKANDAVRKQALMLAFTQLSAFSYLILKTEGHKFVGTIESIDEDEWAALDPEWLIAFQKAQVVQADYNLGGAPTEKAIADGLQSTTIGEVSQFFRPRASLVMAVCRQALYVIGQYICWQPITGRA